jgi:hypothetical protein
MDEVMVCDLWCIPNASFLWTQESGAAQSDVSPFEGGCALSKQCSGMGMALGLGLETCVEESQVKARTNAPFPWTE